MSIAVLQSIVDETLINSQSNSSYISLADRNELRHNASQKGYNITVYSKLGQKENILLKITFTLSLSFFVFAMVRFLFFQSLSSLLMFSSGTLWSIVLFIPHEKSHVFYLKKGGGITKICTRGWKKGKVTCVLNNKVFDSNTWKRALLAPFWIHLVGLIIFNVITMFIFNALLIDLLYVNVSALLFSITNSYSDFASFIHCKSLKPIEGIVMSVVAVKPLNKKKSSLISDGFIIFSKLAADEKAYFNT
jgi:hypothetical protein